MLTTVEGVYKNGKVELVEAPSFIKEGPVLVVFLERKTNGADGSEQTSVTSEPSRGQMIRLGMFAGLIETTEEDFKLAEFHGDPDDGLDW